MARRYGDELKKRVKAAHEKLVERHPKVPRLGDHWVADPALRSELLQLVTGCPWTEAERAPLRSHVDIGRGMLPGSRPCCPASRHVAACQHGGSPRHAGR